MEQRNKEKDERNLLPFPIIRAASEGDAEAMQMVLKHYESYIVKLSTRIIYDKFGKMHCCVDETLRRRLETKLIAKTLDFRLNLHKEAHI